MSQYGGRGQWIDVQSRCGTAGRLHKVECVDHNASQRSLDRA